MKFHVIQPRGNASGPRDPTDPIEVPAPNQTRPRFQYTVSFELPVHEPSEDDEGTQTTPRCSDSSISGDGKVTRTYTGNPFIPNIVKREPITKPMSPIRLPIIKTNFFDNFPGGKEIVKLYPLQHGPDPPRFRQLGFLDLPRELRNQIYGYLADTPKLIIDRNGAYPLNHQWYTQRNENCFHEQRSMTSIRKTCSKVYEEATSLVYGNTFVFRDYYDLCGFLTQLARVRPDMRVKSFRKVVLHIGQDKHRLARTINPNDDDEKVLRTVDRGWSKPHESSSVVACGWWKAIVMLLHYHKVEELVLVAGSCYRQLLTKKDVKKPLILNLLKTNFGVGTLTISDISPAVDLSQYTLPRELKIRWEASKRQPEGANLEKKTTYDDDPPVPDHPTIPRPNIAYISSLVAESSDPGWLLTHSYGVDKESPLSFTDEGLDLSTQGNEIPDDLDWETGAWVQWRRAEDEMTSRNVDNQWLMDLANFGIFPPPAVALPVQGQASALYPMQPYVSDQVGAPASSNEQETGHKRAFDEFAEGEDPQAIAKQDLEP